jgi:hypothetical protein
MPGPPGRVAGRVMVPTEVHKGGCGMKASFKTLLVLALSLGVVAVALAQDKEVTLKGKITCAKCDLKKADKCATVIVVKEDGKDVVYYFDDKSHKDNHKSICTEPKDGSVTGKVSEKDGKKVITATKVDIK